MVGLVASFPRKRGGLLYLLLSASMLTVSLGVLSVAPDDFQSECTAFAEPGSFNNPNQKVLLDTQFYPSTTLLNVVGVDGLWISLDFDMTTGTTTSKWADQSQSLTCKHNLIVCGYTDGNQENWMISQFINISTIGVTELILNATFSAVTSQACNGVCTDSVRIRIFESSEPDEVARNDTLNYGGNVASLEHIMDQNPVQNLDLVQIPISGASTGLYLAVLDLPPGTCISILRLALFYYVCPEQVVNLVKYPETISPTLTSDSDVFLEANCVDNAVLVAGDDQLECSRRGRWEINDLVCDCMEGHYYSGDSCEPCGLGTYKDTVGNDITCVKCPNKSNSTLPGAAMCTCDNGYYRAMDESAAHPCTAPPGPPSNLRATGTTISSISLSWNAPTNDGGRDDLFYTIRYTDAQGPSEVVERVIGTMYTLSDLASEVDYTVTLVSQNGVSSNENEMGRTITRTFSTDAVGASAPESVDLDGDVLSWRRPATVRGDLTKYQIVFTAVNAAIVTRRSDPSPFDVSSSATSQDLHELDVAEGSYVVQVRAVTTVGEGQLSAAINYIEDGVSDSSTGSSATGIAIGVVIVVLLAICTAIAIIGIILFIRRKNSKAATCDYPPTQYRDLTEEKAVGIEIPDGKSATPPKNRMYVDPRTYSSLTDAMNQVRVREIPPKELANLDEIGVGEFGLVYKATWVTKNIAVAVKTLKGSATQEQKENFLMEASVMGQFNHPNVVRLCGVVSRVDPVMLIMEFLENGSLDRYLKKNLDKFSRKRQLKIALGVASGMNYLSDVSFVHRDLAARNVLVGKNEVCKVADFGLAREMTDNEYGVNRGGRIPVRWTAPEAIAYRSFTTASDVWSFGVLIWEIMTYGQTPYETLDNHTLLDQLDKGLRLEQPLNCPDEIYQLMLMCWAAERSERPSFSQLEEMLAKMIDGGAPKATPRHSARPSSDLKTPIEKWLQDIQMERYCDNFINQGLRKLGDILELDEGDLEDMGITLAGHQHKIIKNIRIKQEELGDSC